jgi:hypothetical protein
MINNGALYFLRSKSRRNQYICNRDVAVAQHNNEYGGKVNGSSALYSEVPISNICPVTASPTDLPQTVFSSPPIKHGTLPETRPRALFSTPFLPLPWIVSAEAGRLQIIYEICSSPLNLKLSSTSTKII